MNAKKARNRFCGMTGNLHTTGLRVFPRLMPNDSRYLHGVQTLIYPRNIEVSRIIQRPFLYVFRKEIRIYVRRCISTATFISHIGYRHICVWPEETPRVGQRPGRKHSRIHESDEREGLGPDFSRTEPAKADAYNLREPPL